MKTMFFSLLLFTVSMTTKAQKEISLQDISKHVGDSVAVGGKVYSTKAVSNGKLVLLNLGGAFPNQLVTIVLNEEIQKVLKEPLQREIQEISIAGKVELFKEKPQIVITKPEQIHRITTEKWADKPNQ